MIKWNKPIKFIILSIYIKYFNIMFIFLGGTKMNYQIRKEYKINIFYILLYKVFYLLLKNII